MSAKKKTGAKQAFRTVLLSGHKGAAVIVPFDPEEIWKIPARPVASPTYGSRPGHLVSGTLNGRPFSGWIGRRWGRFFILVDESLQESAGISVGEEVEVTVEPRRPSRVR